MEKRSGARLHKREIRWTVCLEEIRGRLNGREIRCKAAWKRD